MTEEGEPTPLYQVVVNDEEQYSIWSAEKPPPSGWQHRGATGTKEECLDYIETVWTDMRPRSLKVWMESRNPEEA